MTILKVLWAVTYSDVDDIVRIASQIRAGRVAIRTSNNVYRAIEAFRETGVEVYGWRWPYSDIAGAKIESDRVAKLFKAGLAGYYADPERDPGEPWDWDKPNLEKVATAFCKSVRDASGGKPFGVTSHFRAAEVFPHLPWKQFVSHADVLLPQAYWRSSAGRIGAGKPEINYAASLKAWRQIAGDSARIEPMAGELGSVTAEEILGYGAAARANEATTMHFYTYEQGVSHEVWEAIRSL